MILILVVLLAWPVGLLFYANASLNHVAAGTSSSRGEGTTYLFAGSDSRDGWNPEDPTEGERSDSTILVHKAKNGQAVMVSLPRDLYVSIPGVGMNKLNAAFSIGGPPLLVETVEQITGLTVNHYVEIGMGGVSEVVDALGGVELCWDDNVSDVLSGMEWQAGCHKTEGEQALAFARMRYSDPNGDLGRAQRQRQLMGAVVKKTLSPTFWLNPFREVAVAKAGGSALTVGERTNMWNVATLLLTMRKATGGDMTGIPPVSSYGEMTEVGSVVLLDETLAPIFFQKLRNGELTPNDFQSLM